MRDRGKLTADVTIPGVILKRNVAKVMPTRQGKMFLATNWLREDGVGMEKTATTATAVSLEETPDQSRTKTMFPLRRFPKKREWR